jgi:rhamnulokinase
VLAQLGRRQIYFATGIQLMPNNTLYSLYAQHLADPSLLETATDLLFIPDLLNYWLSGQRAVEATIASTSQLLDVRTRTWCGGLLDELGLPRHFLSQSVVEPGTVLGPLRREVAERVSLPTDTMVVAPATHDTASAVVAVPASTEPTNNWCYLSSGTWSLLGCELPSPCITAASECSGFTNELGYGSTVRFLKNIGGLWLVQECRREWQQQGHDLSYSELTRQAAAAAPFRTVIDATNSGLQSPGQMLDKINHLATAAGQPSPRTPGEYVRCCLESLALAYRDALQSMQRVLGCQFDVIHIVGGGARNDLLNQMTASATGLPVVAGPSEATALGNALVQALATGAIRSWQEARQVVLHSFETQMFHPHDHPAWMQAHRANTG